MNRHLIIPVLAVTIAGATAFAASQASAQTADDTPTRLVQRIAQRFNLSESDVQVVFNEARADHRIEMQARFEERLNAAVTNGSITQEQKQAIITKHTELMAEHEAEYEALRDMTPEERRAHHASERAELEAWAESQNIDLQFFMPMGRKGGNHMRGAYGAPAEFNKQ